MPVPANMTLTGTKQGKIEGACDTQGREGTILVQEMHHPIELPKDPQTGQPTGQRVHRPLTVCKEFDKSSPKLQKALTKGERLSEVEIKWYKINPQGEEVHYYTTRMEDAIIVSIVQDMKNCLDTSNEPFRHMEYVSFTYRKIIWRYEEEGIEAEDDWRVRT